MKSAVLLFAVTLLASCAAWQESAQRAREARLTGGWHKEGVSAADTQAAYKKCEYQAKAATPRSRRVEDEIWRELELERLCMQSEGFKR